MTDTNTTTANPATVTCEKVYAGTYRLNGGTHLAIAADFGREWGVHDLRGLSAEKVERIEAGMDEAWVQYRDTLRDCRAFVAEVIALDDAPADDAPAEVLAEEEAKVLAALAAPRDNPHRIGYGSAWWDVGIVAHQAGIHEAAAARAIARLVRRGAVEKVVRLTARYSDRAFYRVSS